MLVTGVGLVTEPVNSNTVLYLAFFFYSILLLLEASNGVLEVRILSFIQWKRLKVLVMHNIG